MTLYSKKNKIWKADVTPVCFADASTQAMCADVYLRHKSSFGEVSVGLLVSKTKVSPVKPVTFGIV